MSTIAQKLLKQKRAAVATLEAANARIVQLEGQLEGQLKIATDIGADRNKYKNAWTRITSALSCANWQWCFGTPCTLEDAVVEEIHKRAARTRELEGIVSLKSAAAVENERKYLALEVENKDLRESNEVSQRANACLRRQVQDREDHLKAAQETIDSQNLTLRRQADEASCGRDYALRRVRFLVTKVENATNRDERSQAEIARLNAIFGGLHRAISKAHELNGVSIEDRINNLVQRNDTQSQSIREIAALVGVCAERGFCTIGSIKDAIMALRKPATTCSICPGELSRLQAAEQELIECDRLFWRGLSIFSDSDSLKVKIKKIFAYADRLKCEQYGF